MFTFGQASPKFKIGKPGLFKKDALSPTEFGREIVRLGFNIGAEPLKDYYALKDKLSPGDLQLLAAVKSNPGYMQALYASLIAGSFVCYATLLLHANETILRDIESGILVELRSTMSGLGGELIEHFKSMTINFAKVIGKEISNLEEDASVKYFQFYAISYYFSDLPEDSRPIPIGLAANLSRVGSSLMVACQNVYNIKLINV